MPTNPDLADPDRLLTLAEREAVEAQSYNFARTYGTPMRLPPTLYEQLRIGGVDMRHIVADKTLEQ